MISEDDARLHHDIDLLCQQQGNNKLYPRPDLVHLSQYLKSRNPKRHPTDSPGRSFNTTGRDARSPFVLTHELSTGDSTGFGPSDDDMADFSASNDTAKSSILFVQGYASPEWLNAIGNKHKNCVELFRRHLQFEAFTSGGRDLYSSPALPSTSGRVFQLTIPTICARNVEVSDWEPEDLQNSRKSQSEAMGRYLKQLRTRAKVGDSVIRRSILLSKKLDVWEQTISVQVEPHEDHWTAVVWLDNGNDLANSFEGPWKPREGTRPWETYFFPVIVPQPSDITQPTVGKSEYYSPFSTPLLIPQSHGHGSAEWRAAQNICHLPMQYGSRLDKDLASKDALYGLSELFQFAAAAEAQFLNLISARIQQEMSFVGYSNVARNYSTSLLNLKYIKTQLKLHMENLSEITSILNNRQISDWPKAESSGSSERPSVTERTSVLLTLDFEHLLHRAGDLARECDLGVETLVNSSVLDESRRSYHMAVKVQRLTIIATIFIPLSFICSVWGMNFQELGSGTQPIWKYFASALPVIAFSLVVYTWDSLARFYKRLRAERGS